MWPKAVRGGSESRTSGGRTGFGGSFKKVLWFGGGG